MKPLIDNIVYYDTPEGISLSFVPAGVVPRVLAWLIDLVIRLVLGLVLAFVLSLFDELGVGLFNIVGFLLMWFYPVVFDMLWNGQTIGKRVFKLRACMDNGMPITWQASMIRNLLIFADFLPALFFSGLLAMLFNHKAKRIGDVVAGTMVVYTTSKLATFDIVEHPAILPPMTLTFEEQQAILTFVERAESLSDERVAELVAILATMTGKTDIDGAADEILGYANAIVGAKVG